jgi:hypothetical protein
VLGHAPIVGECTIHWVQKEDPAGASLRGFGCEFYNPGEETMSYVCNMLNGIRTRQIPQEYFVTVAAREIAEQTASATTWIENLAMSRDEQAAENQLELKCYPPVLLANLMGLGRTLRANSGSRVESLRVDLSERNKIIQFKISCKTDEAINPDQISRMIPSLLLACGGREMLAVHKAGIEFDLGGGARSALFRMPTKSADQL